RPTIAPKPIFARSKRPVTSLLRGSGISFPATIVTITQIVTNSSVPTTEVRNTSLNAGSRRGRAGTAPLLDCSATTAGKRGSSLQIYWPRLSDQTEPRAGFLMHSAATAAISRTNAIVNPSKENATSYTQSLVV